MASGPQRDSVSRRYWIPGKKLRRSLSEATSAGSNICVARLRNHSTSVSLENDLTDIDDTCGYDVMLCFGSGLVES